MALLTAAPQARRLLAPLCRMLGIEAAVLAPQRATDAGSDEIARVKAYDPVRSGASVPAPATLAASRLEVRATAPPDG